MTDRIEQWVVDLCQAPRRIHRENKSLFECLEDANPDLADDDRSTTAIEHFLRANPELVTDWQLESDDTRGSPNHYVNEREVGFYDAGYHDRITHDDEISACADFVYRKAVWVLTRRRVRQVRA